MLRLSGIILPVVAATGLFLGLTSHSNAEDTIRVGVISHDTGPFAQNGEGFHRGIAAYQAIHGDTIGGRQVEFIFRDIGGPNPAVGRRLAEELIVRDSVHILAGFALSSEALAVASIVEQTQTPAITFIASSPAIMAESQFFLKSGQHIAQSSSAGAIFARRAGAEKCYIVVSDYQPGYDAQHAFRKSFEEEGGEIVGEVRVPLNTVDFAGIVERITTTEIDCINVFVPPGAPAIGLLRALAERGLVEDNFVVGMGEAEDHILPQYDESVIGFKGALYYAESLENEQNQQFVAKLKELYGPDTLPEFAAASAFDGAHLIYQMIASQEGKDWNGPDAIEAVKGMEWDAVRGPIKIDAETRELIHNIYLREVRMIDGKLQNVVVDQLDAVEAPTLEWMQN